MISKSIHKILNINIWGMKVHSKQVHWCWSCCRTSQRSLNNSILIYLTIDTPSALRFNQTQMMKISNMKSITYWKLSLKSIDYILNLKIWGMKVRSEQIQYQCRWSCCRTNQGSPKNSILIYLTIYIPIAVRYIFQPKTQMMKISNMKGMTY